MYTYLWESGVYSQEVYMYIISAIAFKNEYLYNNI